MSAIRALFCIGLLATALNVAFSTVALKQGFKLSNRSSWDKLANKPLDDVKLLISQEMPGIRFAVYSDKNYTMFPEEAYMYKVRLVVNDRKIVILPPKYFGTEPDVSLIKNIEGELICKGIKIIRKKIPETKIVIQDVDDIGGYIGAILVKVDYLGMVKEAPTFVISP